MKMKDSLFADGDWFASVTRQSPPQRFGARTRAERWGGLCLVTLANRSPSANSESFIFMTILLQASTAAADCKGARR